MKMKPTPARTFTLWPLLGGLVVISLALVFDCHGQLVPKSRVQPRETRTRAAEQLAIGNGWEKLTVTVDGASRHLLWKGTARWEKGTIIVMHGGGGAAVDWCHAPKTGIPMIDQTLKAQVDFSNDAIARGFAVFSLESSDDLVTDDKGLRCGKRFDATVVEGRKNVDLPFIEKVIREVIAPKRPKGSSPSIFMTGESTGGFMTVRAATHFDGLITAFAPGAACDPYGTYFDASVDTGREARGVAIDCESGKRITESGAGGPATVTSYPHEKTWATMNPPTKPPFMGLHHRDDGIVDISCHEKLIKQLRAHGYPMEADLVLKGTGQRNIAAHLWQADYNDPVLRFFARHSAAPGQQ